MGFACTLRFQGWLGLGLLAVASAVVWAAKPAPPPPPPPPPITFNLKLFPTTETATVLSLNGINGMNEAGVVVGHYSVPYSSGLAYPRVYLGGTVWDANDLMTSAQQDLWNIERVFDINNNYQIACRAQYQGAAGGGLIPGEYYVGLLDINPVSESVGTVTPIFEYTLGGTVASAAIYGMNDWGTVCGYIRRENTRYAFIMSPGDDSPTYLFEDPSDLDAVYSDAYQINNSGQVVGRRNGKGYRYTPGEPMLILGRIETGKNIGDLNSPRSINSLGEFTGSGSGKGGMLPYAYAEGVGMVKLSSTTGTGTGINDRGDVIYDYGVGGSFILLGVENQHVNLLTAGVVPGNSTEVTRFRSNNPRLECLNEGRVICGWFIDYNTSSGNYAFILTPVP